MRVDPDCSGRCACSQTAAHSAIASITSRRKSFGCGLVNRMRSTPSVASTARRSCAKSVPRSRPYELTFWPSSVNSRTPAPASRPTSARISPGRRETSRPRTAGTMQYEHTELQPIEICTQAWKTRSRCIGSCAAKRRSSPVPKRAPVDAEPARAEPLREVRDRPRPERDVDLRVEREQPVALRLGVAAADGDHGVRPLPLLRCGVAEVRGELRVGLLADRAGVEDEHVGLVAARGLAETELLEHALDALRVVRVHLAAEGGDEVAPVHCRKRSRLQG